MAESLHDRFELESSLVKGRGGVFEVRLDGELMFSKAKVHRFPEPGEVENAIAQRLSS